MSFLTTRSRAYPLPPHWHDGPRTSLGVGFGSRDGTMLSELQRDERAVLTRFRAIRPGGSVQLHLKSKCGYSSSSLLQIILMSLIAAPL